jgi:hypothetical protein
MTVSCLAFFVFRHTQYANNTTELTNWLINAFNGEWIKIANPKPNGKKRAA